jgi:hypothetical protein
MYLALDAVGFFVGLLLPDEAAHFPFVGQAADA